MKLSPIKSVKSLLNGDTAKQGSIVLLDQGFLSIANFSTGVLVARACSKEEYGLYVLAWSLLLIFSSILRAIVQVPFTIYIPRLPDPEKNTYQGSALIHSLGLGIVLTLIVITAPTLPFMQHGKWNDLATIAPVLAILVVPYLLREFIRSALFARLDFFSSLTANIAATTIQLAAIGTLYATGKLQVINALEAILAASIFASLFMLWAHKAKIVIHAREILTDMKRGWSVSKWVLINVVGTIGTSHAFPWLLLSLIDTKSVAIYGAAMAVSAVVSPFLRAVNAYILPRMAHGFREGDTMALRRMLNRSIAALAIPYGIWTIIGSVYAKEILTFLYSNEYSGYGLIVILLLIKAMIESVSAPMTSTLLTLERPDITTKALFLGTFATFSVAPFAITKLGIAGAAEVAILSASIVSLYKYVRIKAIIHNLEKVKT